ncbi:hypothetical protein FOXG_20953 [Fusarium oxysporum f. sp. lycopersici 4287]|uniref:Uncharacterized protein n=1 Tax=Fusarium oxysporum f. sp. lycopersici (strain 4287 / CBS 123668 / FGSC 9935 / NRRL 34936) TaxID=426428 RepID=A0A0J9VS79_FUSO4|nr:hypothetical protein FOXG_20953 [Fusarium oxysporum f. sp. lycopersici 4287]EWZ79265.1 hypothetical protein FOWG_16551 [Fusarium oxysporum f. sp. lycopersici MN25]KNB13849.1 hypothetical protein FOXG_20953 [Fusarium oxysporum f. sp. lycopersici 4287]
MARRVRRASSEPSTTLSFAHTSLFSISSRTEVPANFLATKVRLSRRRSSTPCIFPNPLSRPSKSTALLLNRVLATCPHRPVFNPTVPLCRQARSISRQFHVQQPQLSHSGNDFDGAVLQISVWQSAHLIMLRSLLGHTWPGEQACGLSRKDYANKGSLGLQTYFR